jgi:hypothetical protein
MVQIYKDPFGRGPTTRIDVACEMFLLQPQDAELDVA